MLYLIFYCLIQSQFLFSFGDVSSDPNKNGHDFILCRKCGSDIGDSSYITKKLSPGAQTHKQNIFGQQNVTIQTLVNPYGVKFDIVTIEKALCDNVGPRHGADSWFPSYTWRICTCPHCGQHLGWTFEPISQTDEKSSSPFHGLILGNVLGENFTDSLIMMPKMYRM